MTDTKKTYDCRDSWAATLVEVGKANPDVIAVVNDSVGSSKLNNFEKELPKQTVNVGIAEQNMVGVGAGLANGGKIPFVSAAGSFLSARATEQVKADVAYSQNNVKLVAQSPGVAYGNLGPTHHSLEDLAWLRVLPGLAVVAPADPVDTAAAVRWAADYDGPVYLRISRMPVPQILPDDYEFELGKSVLLRDGDDVTLIGTGTTSHRALAAAELLEEQGISARVLHMPTVTPLDEEAVLAAAEETGGIITAEEATVSGLGGAVAEFLSEKRPTPMCRLGFKDQFPQTGPIEWLFEQQGLTAEGIRNAAAELVAETKE